MKKNFLLTPGPTPVPAEVLLAMATPSIHHRTPQFKAIFKEMNENLKYLFQTQNDVFTFACSGTGAMEAAVVNLLSAGDKAICVQGGKFGERWGEICRAYNIDFVPIDVEWGIAVEPEEIAQVLKKHKDAKVVFTTQCETSTGVLNDIKAIAEITKGTDTVLVVDAISSLGGVNLETDSWGVDVVVTGSQKGLMIPPGLAFCSVSKKAQGLVEKAKSPRYYFDFRLSKKALDKSDTAFTPAITLCIGLNEALKMIKRETLEVIFERNRKLARAVRAAMRAMGLKIFAKDPADVVTAVCSPKEVDSDKLVKIMRDEYGVSIAGGQAQLKGKIFRIAQLGYVNEFDLVMGISCLETVLSKMGYKFELGKGIGAFEAELLK
ncbi:MAG: alanine--glyoxylate aminotransferase family protein [Candidatus Omnitrophica bacterium]|nr:alanine--glyoxylate aminotransferase family protein [Candidatus Omnitrophota bacterium]MBU1925420.1 alanine--glyoxylate aminotransferase family protein [Candidatus Omnitrophota bacterium]